jgi:DNA polymerase-1
MLELAPTTPLCASYLRSRARKVEAVCAAMTEVGVVARWVGGEFELAGLDRLTGPDRALLERLRPEIQAHLAEPGPADPEELLEQLDVEIEVVDDPGKAREVIAALPDTVAVDIETEPRIPLPPPALRLTKNGRRYLSQPPADTTGASLCPFRGKPRLIQVFDPGSSVVFVFDLHALDYGDLEGLFDRCMLFHSLFEPTVLGAQGVEISRPVDTLQIASLALGCGFGTRKLQEISRQVLGVDLPKDLQTSYWAARHLSDAQLVYAAADAVVTYRAGRAMYRMLGAREREAFKLANEAVPVVARMRLRGLPFDRDVHRQTIAGWQNSYASERRRFLELTGTDVPLKPDATRAWIEDRLPEEALKAWKRTDTGVLSIEAAELKRKALDWPEVRPLLAMRTAEKRISTFGPALLGLIVQETGRLHGDYFFPLTSGRLSCRKPNLQQLPSDVRRAVIAPLGTTLLVADFSQIELRIIAELADEQVMRSAFASGQDIHALTAAAIVGGGRYDGLPPEEKALVRKKAKASNFGLSYGMGTATFRAKAWDAYDLDMSFAEADALRDTFFDTYPAIRPYQFDQADQGRAEGVVYSIAGRPRRAEWEKDGELWFTHCCNFPIQASAADVMLDAMVRVDRELPGTIVASIHDELVLEVEERWAGFAADVLTEQMTAAFIRWFPDAPTEGLVDVKSVTRWSDAK